MAADGGLVLNVSIAEAAGLAKVCDPYCTCTLQLAGPGPDPWLLISPRNGKYKQQVTRTETAKRTEAPKWRTGVGRYQIKDASPTACLELCLLANRLLGSEVLGKTTVELQHLLSEPRTDRWYSIKSKKNVDAGSVRLVTVIDGADVGAPAPASPANPSPGAGDAGTAQPYFESKQEVSGGKEGPWQAENGAYDQVATQQQQQQQHGAMVAPPPPAGGANAPGANPPPPQGGYRTAAGRRKVPQIPIPGQSPGQQGSARNPGPGAPSPNIRGGGGGGTFQYKIGEIVGRGAFGKVFQAMNLADGELMAIKCVELNNVSKEELEEIQNEVNLLRTLRHRHVVSYIGTHTMDNSFNILMEYCPGGSVSTLLKSFGAFDEPVLRQYTRQCYEGIAYIHSHAVMHRDIKGANILVAANGSLKIADFGASAQLRGTVTEQNDTASLRGTPFWMAPEVIRQERYGRSADCWSMGMTVIEMATANHPWSKATNKFSLMYEIASTDHLPDIPATLSAECQDFILQSINRNVEARMSADQALLHPFIAGVVTRRPQEY